MGLGPEIGKTSVRIRGVDGGDVVKSIRSNIVVFILGLILQNNEITQYNFVIQSSSYITNSVASQFLYRNSHLFIYFLLVLRNSRRFGGNGFDSQPKLWQS